MHSRPDSGQGTLEFDGRTLDRDDTPVRRQEIGIVTIYQEFNLLPAMSVAENMYLGREPLRNGLINWGQMFKDAQKIISDLGLELGPRTLVRSLSVAEQQMVEISKALTMNAKLIIMDEPTAALSGREVDKLHEIIRDLKAKGISIIYVSHKLNEVKAICDRYTIFRDGKYITSGKVADVTIDDMVRLMVGRDVEFLRKPPHRRAGRGRPEGAGRVPCRQRQRSACHRPARHVGRGPSRRDRRLCRPRRGRPDRARPGDLRRRPLR